jgi:hypothetical protein
MSFANLKKQSRTGSLTDKLIKSVEKLNEKGNGADERIWKPSVDKTGNGYAVIRFLPEAEGNELPWARVYTHAFQGPGGWFIENSLTTLGQKCPISEYNSTLWNNGTDSGKEQARKQKRKLSYYSNIYVVNDPANPDNEGKIMEAMKPEFDDEEPINPFDFWSGANFKLKIRKVEGYQNYDKSEFDKPSALFDDDDRLEKLYNNLYDLNEFLDPKNFKDYAALEKRLQYALGLKGTPKMQDRETQEQEAQWERERRGDYTEPSAAGATYEDMSEGRSKSFNDPDITGSNTEEEDDSLNYFAKLVNS